MKRIFVHTSTDKNDLQMKASSQTIGRTSKSLGSQLPQFRDVPLIYCSFVCDGYPGIYTHPDRDGIAFETDQKEIYALPCDNFELMRGGNFLPGHERFIFQSLEEMLKAYPSTAEFKRAFQEFFKSLKPREVYPGQDRKFATRLYDGDYCLNPINTREQGYNEIAFQKPLRIKNPTIFHGTKELNILLAKN